MEIGAGRHGQGRAGARPGRRPLPAADRSAGRRLDRVAGLADLLRRRCGTCWTRNWACASTASTSAASTASISAATTCWSFRRSGAGPTARPSASGGVKRLKHWIEAGGTAIGIGGGADFLADDEQRDHQHPPAPPGAGAVPAGRARPARRTRRRRPAPSAPWGCAPRRRPKTTPRRKKKSASPPSAPRRSPYDVAPILGPGAQPFAAGHDQGTPVEMKPVDLAEWIAPLPAAGQGQALEGGPGAGRRAAAPVHRLAAPSCGSSWTRSVWLTWGVPAELPALFRARDTLVAEPPVQVAARFAEVDRLHLGGLLWPEAAGRLAHTAYATREGKGRGQVILFPTIPSSAAGRWAPGGCWSTRCSTARAWAPAGPRPGKIETGTVPVSWKRGQASGTPGGNHGLGNEEPHQPHPAARRPAAR